MRGGLFASLLAGLVCVTAPGVQAQDVGTVQSEILVLDLERLFSGTQVGQRLTGQYQDERDKLIARNRQIEADLRAEEQELTEMRDTVTPERFREMADAFDARVRELRQQNERAARDLERGREVAPFTLMRMAEPVLVQVMRDAGGTVILDNRQVLLRADVIDITDLAIARIDAAIGDGSGLTPPPEPDAPEGTDETSAPPEMPDAPE